MRRRKTLVILLLGFAAISGLIFYPVVRSVVSEKRMRVAVAAMGLPPGASARTIPPSMIFLVAAGYEIHLQPFDASADFKLDHTITGVPDTGHGIELYWRIPKSQEGLWKKSQSQIQYKLTIGNQVFAGHAKFQSMTGMESGADLGSIYLYDFPGLIDARISPGVPVRIEATYEPGPGESLDYKIEPIIQSCGKI